jgi:hypothetical protein
MKEILPPQAISKRIFLAGTIENGNSIDWQNEVIEKLSHTPHIFLNPRRRDWDATWEQKKTNPKFVEQVLWELKGLEAADIIVMNFIGGTISPISLLELGIHMKSGKIHVVCSEEYWRVGNVDVTCEFYGVKQYETLNDLIKFLDEQE